MQSKKAVSQTNGMRQVSREAFLADPAAVVRDAANGAIAVHDLDGSISFTVSRPVISDEDLLRIRR